MDETTFFSDMGPTSFTQNFFSVEDLDWEIEVEEEDSFNALFSKTIIPDA